MELKPQLVPKLKALRLSGILETLEVRNQQAIADKLSYVEFLERLLEDEIERRGQKQLMLRLRRASFVGEKGLESFDWSFNPTINRQAVLDLAAGQWIARKEGVLIVGDQRQPFLPLLLPHQELLPGCLTRNAPGRIVLLRMVASGKSTCVAPCSPPCPLGSALMGSRIREATGRLR
jgi:hypothetical protein